MKGALITIYGINNLGKTTHATLLSKHIEDLGLNVKQLKYPIYDIEPSGPVINNALRSDSQKMSEEELQLWYVINRYQYQSELQRLLDEGYIVVAEDYSGTGISWGCAKGLDEDWIISANSKLIQPDLAILFEGKRFLSAKENVHIHEQNDSLMEKCKIVHEKMAERFAWIRMGVEEKMEDTAKKLWSIVDFYLVTNGFLNEDRQKSGLNVEKMIASLDNLVDKKA